MEDMVGIKELYDVTLRLNNPLEIGDKRYEINESVLNLSKVEIAQISQNKSEVSAHGGYADPALVTWETDREVTFVMTNGVLSPLSWALISNSRINNPKVKSVQYYETLKTYIDGPYCFVDLKYCPNHLDLKLGAQPNPFNEKLPMGRREELLLKPLPPSKTKWIFCYDTQTGQKIKKFFVDGNRVYFLSQMPREVIVDYTFTYEDQIETIEMGNRLFNGFLRLDGKMSVKNANSGEVTTAILEMPKVKLSSSLSMRLGKSYENSTVNDFYFVGYPDEMQHRKNQSILNITFLDKELTGDYI